jgi:surface antigen
LFELSNLLQPNKTMLTRPKATTEKVMRVVVSALAASGILFPVSQIATMQTAQAASYCECVGYVKRVIGISDATPTAHAADWDNNVLPNYGYKRLSGPQVGAIVVIERNNNGGFNSTYGHIGIIVGIQSDGRIQIKGANQGGNGIDANCNNVNTIVVYPISAMSYWAKGGSTGGTTSSTFNSVNFTGVTSNYRTNVRSGASTNSTYIGYINPNTRVSFSGWMYGDAVNDLWTGRPDRRWYRIAGTNYYVASATVNGNAPGSQP